MKAQPAKTVVKAFPVYFGSFRGTMSYQDILAFPVSSLKKAILEGF